mmetsp:Transcript_7827/g.34860  ORF Transcript_7827/g.34860 Transcript_7827/m.34860 type:complete len:83 (+) Transcript_7827:166-414(+)
MRASSSRKSSDRSTLGRKSTEAEFTVPYLGEFLVRPEKIQLIDLDENELLQIPLPAEHVSSKLSPLSRAPSAGGTKLVNCHV